MVNARESNLMRELGNCMADSRGTFCNAIEKLEYAFDEMINNRQGFGLDRTELQDHGLTV